MIAVSVVLDSTNPVGDRLTTFLLRYPKFVHAEVKTHRLISIDDEEVISLQEISLMDEKSFSRNASSSRAIPTERYIEEARSDKLRAVPAIWGSAHKGMMPGEPLTGASLERVQYLWKIAALNAANTAEDMMCEGAAKSQINRVLDPFIHINVLATTARAGLANFLGLRLDVHADPTIRTLAEAMWDVYRQSKPEALKPDEWHLPFIDTKTWDEALSYAYTRGPHAYDSRLAVVRAVSVARCARLSYLSFETGKRSMIAEDLALYDRLITARPIHASPAEHQATPDYFADLAVTVDGIDDKQLMSSTWHVKWAHPEQAGNLGLGWRQYRKMIDGEAIAELPEVYR